MIGAQRSPSLYSAVSAGIFGAVLVSILLALGRASGLSSMNIEVVLGTLITGTAPRSIEFTVGFIWSLVNGALLSFVYVACFRAMSQGGPGTGAMLGAVNWLLASVFLGLLIALRPAIPTHIANDIDFGGSKSYGFFLLGHLLYGVTVGTFYNYGQSQFVESPDEESSDKQDRLPELGYSKPVKNALLARHRKEIAEFLSSHSPTLFVFDYDGTLAPITKNRARAGMRKTTQSIFTRFSEKHPTVILTGRSRSDVKKKIGKSRLKFLVGNHGLDWGEKHSRNFRLEKMVGEWGTLLSRVLSDKSGIEIEMKNLSLSIHYRNSPRPKSAKHEIKKTLPGLLKNAKWIFGKRVVDVIPNSGTNNKGLAILKMKKLSRASSVVFVGDDTTDELGFALRRKIPMITVRIEKSRNSKAEYFISHQNRIDDWIEFLDTSR